MEITVTVIHSDFLVKGICTLSSKYPSRLKVLNLKSLDFGQQERTYWGTGKGHGRPCLMALFCGAESHSKDVGGQVSRWL